MTYKDFLEETGYENTPHSRDIYCRRCVADVITDAARYYDHHDTDSEGTGIPDMYAIPDYRVTRCIQRDFTRNETILVKLKAAQLDCVEMDMYCAFGDKIDEYEKKVNG